MQSRLRAVGALALALAPFILLAACSSAPPEQQFLTQFFRAARTRDNETLARMSAVEFKPAEQGEVSSFDITSVSEERRTPLDYQSLISAQTKAEAELEEFRNRRREFEGRISGFTMGTGQTLSLLPPQNATGNFVKIVQRLPVRIELVNYHPDDAPLFVGLSATPYVYYKEPPTGPHAVPATPRYRP